MKYIFLLLLIYSNPLFSCIGESDKQPVNESNGFKIVVHEPGSTGSLCENCKEILISGPKNYKNSPFTHGLFMMFYEGEMVSLKEHSYINESGFPEFWARIKNDKKHKFEVTFNYGPSHCSEYIFSYEI